MGFVITLIYLVLTYLTPTYVLRSQGSGVMPFLMILGMIGALSTGLSSQFSFRAPQIYLLAALTGSAAISRIHAGWLGGGIVATESFLPIIGVLLLISLTTNSFSRLRILGNIIVMIGIAYVIIGYFAYYHGYGDLTFLSREGLGREDSDGFYGDYIIRLRGLGFLNDANDLAQFFVICIALLAFNRSKGNLVRNVLLFYVPIALLLFGIYMTHSRGALLGLTVLLAVWLHRIWGKTGLVAAAILGGVFLTAMRLIAGRGMSADESATGRIEAWAAAIQMFKSSPLFGIGYGGFTDHNELTAHNSFALCLAELGYLGSFLWLALIIFSLLQLNSIAKRADTPQFQELSRHAQIVRTALLGFLATAWFLSRSYTVTLFVIVGMAISLTEIAQRCAAPGLVRAKANWLVITGFCHFALMVLLYISIRLYPH